MAGGDGPKPIRGKLGGYYYGGGGGPCEAGCGSETPKKAEPAPKTPQQLAEEERQRKAAAEKNYLNLAKDIYEVGSAYFTIRGVEHAMHKIMWEWAAAITRNAMFTLYLLVRDGGLGVDPFSKVEKDELDAFRQHLDKIKTNDAQNLTPKIPAHELPKHLQRRPYNPDVETEVEVRRKYLKNKVIGKDQAKAEMRKFIREYHGPVIGDLSANMLEVYDQDKIDREGLSQEAIDWIESFNVLVSEMDKRRSEAQPANSCSIPSEKKFCTILGGKVGERCYCNSAPGAYGIATARRIGNVCETKTQFCEVPGTSIWGSSCGCPTASGYMERGTIRW